MSKTGMNIAIMEKSLPMDRIGPMVEAIDMDKKRFVATVLTALDRNPRLMDFPVQQHLQWCASAAVLGLEPDGVTGQAFPIPYGGKNPRVQLIVGYKGFNTMAGRAGIIINSGTLHKGDRFSTKLVAGRPFEVEQAFGDRARSDLVGVWSQAQLPNGHFTQPLLMDLSEVLAVKAKAPGARKGDSPWNDRPVGFAAMAQKTAVRRLQRILPALITPGRQFSTHHVGAQMDMLHEEAGHATHVTLEGELVDEGAMKVEPEAPEIVPAIIAPDGSEQNFGSFEAHGTVVSKLRKTDPDVARKIYEMNKARFADWRTSGNPAAVAAADAIDEAIDERLSE